MPAGKSVESLIMVALEAHLVAQLRNPSPEHGTEMTLVRLDPTDTEPQDVKPSVDVFRRGIRPGDNQTTSSDEHVLRVEASIYADPGAALSDLWWRVRDLVMAATWFGTLVQDVRPAESGEAMRESIPGMGATQSRPLAFDIHFWTAAGNGFAASP
jgi:hypothetical protein